MNEHCLPLIERATLQRSQTDALVGGMFILISVGFFRCSKQRLEVTALPEILDTCVGVFDLKRPDLVKERKRKNRDPKSALPHRHDWATLPSMDRLTGNPDGIQSPSWKRGQDESE